MSSSSNVKNIDEICYSVIKQYYENNNYEGVGISPKGIGKVCNILQKMESKEYNSIFKNITFNAYKSLSDLRKKDDVVISIYNKQIILDICPDINNFAQFIDNPDKDQIKITNSFKITENWNHKFKLCNDILFTKTNGNIITLKGMSNTFVNGSYFTNEKFSAIKFYTSGFEKYSFEIILPNINYNIMDINYGDISNIKYIRKDIIAKIPIYSVVNKINILNYFNGGDLNFLQYKIKNLDYLISCFDQNMSLEVNLDGLKMSVITECIFSRSFNFEPDVNKPVEFIANRSFYWIIRDDKGLILSFGIY